MERYWEEERTRRRMLAVPIVYFFLYMICFMLLEEYVHPKYWISSPLDAYIPFNEFFLIPYVAWFPLIPGMFWYFYKKDPDSYLYLCQTILLGLTICLAIYAILPNGQLLRRPITGNNVLCDLVRLLRKTDTPTNVCPSIHVFVSVTVALAAARSRAMSAQPHRQAALTALVVLICMATVFLKQHSIVDVACGAALSLILDLVVRKSRVGATLFHPSLFRGKAVLES